MAPTAPVVPASPPARVQEDEPARPEYRVTLSLEGLRSNRGEVRLADLLSELQTLNSLLLGLDRSASPDRSVSTIYTVTDLRRVNPSEIDIRGTTKPDAPDVRSIVFSKPFETLAQIEEGRESGFDYDLLEDLRTLAAPVGKRLRSVALSVNGTRVEFTPPLRKRLDVLLQPQYTDHGFIQGRLEAVNIHAGANTFKLYPRCGPVRLTGTFPAEMSEKIGIALGRDVVVRGILHYRADEAYPHAIGVESLKILPRLGELPPFGQLAGSFGNFIGGRESGEWLAQRREEKLGELRMLVGSA